jgi:hypothetical protein
MDSVSGPRPTGLGARRSALERRLTAIDRRLGRIERRLTALDGGQGVGFRGVLAEIAGLNSLMAALLRAANERR